jgi:hypothetical protein
MKFIPRRFFLAVLCILITLLLHSCGEDVPSSPVQNTTFVITQLNVTPNLIRFTPDNGVIDSVLTVSVSGSISQSLPNVEPTSLVMELIRASDSQTIDVRNSILSGSGAFEETITIPSKTTDFNDYRLFVYAITGDKLTSNSAQATIKIRGFAIGVPEILAVNNPDTVRIPSSGTTSFALLAKVIHPNGQSLIDRVLVDIRDQQK